MNKTEKQFYEMAKSEGYEVIRGGWPDFLLLKDGVVSTVEVKRAASEALGSDQVLMNSALSGMGISCLRWSPSSGLSQWDVRPPRGKRGRPRGGWRNCAECDKPIMRRRLCYRCQKRKQRGTS
jgi:hypothetical protein